MATFLTDAEVFGTQGGPVLSDAEVFGQQATPKPIGAAAQGDFLRQELENADFGTRNIAAFGTAASDLWERGKQLFGQGDRQAIEANQVIRDAAPVGAMAGEAAMLAAPFGLAGNSVKAAAAIGGAAGFMRPVGGEQTLGNIAKGTAINTGLGAGLSAAGQVGANAAGKWISGKIAELAAKKAANAPIDKTLADAIEAGFVVPPSSVNPTFATTVKESAAGKIATAQTASNRNAELADALARKAVGLPENSPLTSEAMQTIRKNVYQSGYEPVAKSGTIATDETYKQALDKIVEKYRGAATDFPGAASDSVRKFVEGTRVPGFDAGNGLKMSQILRDEATAAYRAGDTALSKAKREAAKAIEDQIERHLASAGDGAGASELLQNFREARKLMAKTHTVEDAIVEGGGTINAKKLGARVQAGKPMEGDLAVIGNFANNFPRAMQPYQQVAGPAVNQLSGLLKPAIGGMLGIGGTMAGGPVLGAASAAMPFVIPPAMRARLLSRGVQSSLLNRYGLGLGTRAAGRLFKNAPIAGAVLGPNALAEYLALQP